MEPSDQATAYEEMSREISLKFRKPELIFTGICYNCQEVLQLPAKFCDEFCRHDYEVRIRQG